MIIPTPGKKQSSIFIMISGTPIPQGRKNKKQFTEEGFSCYFIIIKRQRDGSQGGAGRYNDE